MIVRIILIIMLLCSYALASQSIEIYCPHCKEHLYTYQGAEFPGNILPPREELIKEYDVGRPRDFVCPFCGAPLNGWEYHFWKKGMNLPKMRAKVHTVWIKTEDGFEWYPYKLNLKE